MYGQIPCEPPSNTCSIFCLYLNIFIFTFTEAIYIWSNQSTTYNK